MGGCEHTQALSHAQGAEACIHACMDGYSSPVKGGCLESYTLDCDTHTTHTSSVCWVGVHEDFESPPPLTHAHSPTAHTVVRTQRVLQKMTLAGGVCVGVGHG